MKPEKTIARLILIVEYDEMPNKKDVERIVDMAREIGIVVVATFATLRPSTVSLM